MLHTLRSAIIYHLFKAIQDSQASVEIETLPLPVLMSEPQNPSACTERGVYQDKGLNPRYFSMSVKVRHARGSKYRRHVQMNIMQSASTTDIHMGLEKLPYLFATLQGAEVPGEG